MKKIVVALLIVIGSFGAIYASDTEQESSDAEKDAWLRLSGGIDSSPVFDEKEMAALQKLVNGKQSGFQEHKAGKRRVRYSRMVREKKKRRPLDRNSVREPLTSRALFLPDSDDHCASNSVGDQDRFAYDYYIESLFQYGLQDPQPLN